jgi:hypothetical protein
VPTQGKVAGIVAGTVPLDRCSEVVASMLPPTPDDDREDMVRIWRMVMPPEVLGGCRASSRARPEWPGGADAAVPGTGGSRLTTLLAHGRSPSAVGFRPDAEAARMHVGR